MPKGLRQMEKFQKVWPPRRLASFLAACCRPTLTLAGMEPSFPPLEVYPSRPYTASPRDPAEMNELNSGRASSVLGHDFTPQVLWSPAPAQHKAPLGRGQGSVPGGSRQSRPSCCLPSILLCGHLSGPLLQRGGGGVFFELPFVSTSETKTHLCLQL